jgi:hypothetical protein
MPTFHGSCHCGAVAYDVDFALEGLITCNCSMCGRSGAIMAFVPRDKVTNLVGEDKLTDYQFASKTIHHLFCSICGVKPLAWGKSPTGDESAMINVRCLDGLDVHQLEIAKQYDGKSR